MVRLRNIVLPIQPERCFSEIRITSLALVVSTELLVQAPTQGPSNSFRAHNPCRLNPTTIQAVARDFSISNRSSGMENGTNSEGRDPSGFLSEIIGAPVTVKLNSGVVYKGALSWRV